MDKWIIIFCLSFCGIIQAQPKQYSINPPGYAVASAHPLATNAGLSILAKGGNAFDAAVAVAAVLAVVEPYGSGLGGGGVWLLHQENTHQNIFIDGRETAPQKASKGMFLDKKGELIPNLSVHGGLAAAIPGEVAAIEYIAQHYGRLPLSKSLAPAIELAEKGFIIDLQFQEYLSRFSQNTNLFLKDDKPYQLGDLLIQNDLANTLKLIAKQGKQGFYHGVVAQKLVNEVNAAGGIWTLEDLAHYTIKIRKPLIGAYRNMLIITAPPPSAGGIALLTMLNILAYHPIGSFHTNWTMDWIHYLVEAMRLAYWQRDQFLGDPDFVKVPVKQLISAENAKRLYSLIPPKKAIPSSILKDPGPKKTAHTTHYSIIDKEGNRVAATLTLNNFFGCGIIAKGTGVLLNDEMDDFSSKVGSENIFGIVGSEKNSIAPNKRPVTSMTPTFLELPGRVAILGTPGGSRIPTMILIASLLFQESHGAISMVSAMRFHHQYLPDVLEFEPDTFPKALQEGLRAMGYVLQPLNEYYGDMQIVIWDKERNQLSAVADPRGIGLGGVVSSSPKK